MTPQRIARLLPAVFRHSIQPGQLLDGLLQAMSELQRPCEEALDALATTCDPRRSPERFLPFLAGWMRFGALCEHGARAGTEQHGKVESTGQLRELLANAAQLAHWRGTARGVRRFLELATGIDGFAIDDQLHDAQGAPRSFHVRITAPAAAQRQIDLIHKVVGMTKPVHVTYELHFA